VLRLGAADARDADEVVVEEPLEIRVAGEPVAVTMRTPGHDRQLALGFLFSEGIVRTVDDVGSVFHCGRPGDEGFGNTVDVIPAPGGALSLERVDASRRGTLTTAACGVCGRLCIDDLLARCAPLADASRVAPATITAAFEHLRARQELFRRTGGIHAAGIFTADGTALAIYEDIGRHNAVDKAVGHLVLERGMPATGAMLLVSGRASFEMVQKAVTAGIAVIASVSAASSLAIDLARRTGATLVAFARDGRMNVYSGEDRLSGSY
jgi:FdhD protein